MRLARRLRRDLVERGRDVDSVLEQVSLSFFLVYFLGFERVPSLLAALTMSMNALVNMSLCLRMLCSFYSMQSS